MQRVDTDENAHLRRDNEYVCAFAKHKGRLVGCEELETTEGLRADPLAVIWIPTISFSVGVHKLTSPFTYAISRTDTPKDKKSIESCCIVFRKKELQVEPFGVSRLPIYGTMGARAEA